MTTAALLELIAEWRQAADEAEAKIAKYGHPTEIVLNFTTAFVYRLCARELERELVEPRDLVA